MAGTKAPGWYSRERKKPTAGYGRNKSPWKRKKPAAGGTGTRVPGWYSRERKTPTYEDRDRNGNLRLTKEGEKEQEHLPE
jgi:hypothetical protein